MRQKTIEVNDIEYTLQMVPTHSWYEFQRKLTNNKHGRPDPIILNDFVFKHVVVSPKTEWRELSISEVEEIAREAMTFLRGITPGEE